MSLGEVPGFVFLRRIFWPGDRIIKIRECFPRQCHPHNFLDFLHQDQVVWGDKSIGFTGVLCSACAPDTMNIGIRRAWHIKIDHMGNPINVKAAGRDIGSHHDLIPAFPKTIQGLAALALGAIPVQAGSLVWGALDFFE